MSDSETHELLKSLLAVTTSIEHSLSHLAEAERRSSRAKKPYTRMTEEQREAHQAKKLASAGPGRRKMLLARAASREAVSSGKPVKENSQENEGGYIKRKKTRKKKKSKKKSKK